jgi:hypothetical protein
LEGVDEPGFVMLLDALLWNHPALIAEGRGVGGICSSDTENHFIENHWVSLSGGLLCSAQSA